MIVSTAAALALLVAPPATAQQDSGREYDKSNQTTNTTNTTRQNLADQASSQDMSHVDRASQMIGKEVTNSADESLGSIDELVINKSEGRIAYAVLLHGDTIGIGGKWIAVPFHALRYDEVKDCFLLDATPAKLEGMKGFDESNWPVEASGGFSAYNSSNTGTARSDTGYSHTDTGFNKTDKNNKQANQYDLDATKTKDTQARRDSDTWGTDKPSQSKQSRENIRADWSSDDNLRWQNRVSQLIGINVVDKSGKQLGELNDLAIELHDGRIAYGVLEFSDSWYDYTGKLFPIPWDNYSYTTSSSEHQMQLKATQEQFKNAEGFDPNDWPDMANKSWGERTHGIYGSQPYWHMYDYPYLAPGNTTGADRDRPGQDDRYNNTTDRQQRRDNTSGINRDNQDQRSQQPQ